MAEEPESLILQMLRDMRASLSRIENDVGDLKLRMSAVEMHLAAQQAEIAGLNKRMDRFDERLGRVERRLELVEA